MTARSDIASIALPGTWTIRVPSVGGMPADGMRVCTDVVIYPLGPWVSFVSNGQPMWVSRPCIIEPYRGQRAGDARSDAKPISGAPPRELKGLKEALASEAAESKPQLRSQR